MENEYSTWFLPYKTKKANVVQSHTEFSGDANVLYCSKNEIPEFLKKYSQMVMEYLKNKKIGKIPCFSEKIDKNPDFTFRFFIDCDWDLKKLVSNGFNLMDDEAANFFEENTTKITNGIHQIFENSGYSDLYNSVIAKRCEPKIHIHFPDAIVTIKTAKELVKKLLVILNEEPNPYFDWKDILDLKAYNTGIRLLGSGKGTFTKVNSQMQDKYYYQQVFTDSSKFPFNDAYTVNETITPELIELCSIHTEKEENIKFRKNKSNTLSIVDSEKVDSAVISYINNNTDIKQLVIETCKQFNDEFGYTLNPSVYKYNTSDEYGRYIILAPQECPFVGRKHNRTVTKNVPCNRLVFGERRVYLRCFACEDEESFITRENKVIHKMDLLMNALLSRTHVAVAELCFFLLKDTLAACRAGSSDKFNWYKFEANNHGWRYYSSPNVIITGSRSGSNSVLETELGQFRSLLLKETDVEVDKQYINEIYGKLMKDIQSMSFIDNMKKYLSQLLHEHYIDENGNTFEQRLDKKANLLRCKNGVLECKDGKFFFRAGLPQDLCMNKCNTVYYDYETKLNKEDKELFHENMRKSMVDEKMRNYLLWVFARGLNGYTRRAKLYSLFGDGSDGKSAWVSLMKHCFGGYYGSGSNAMITGKGVSDSSAAREDIASMDGKRFYFFAEVSPNVAVNMEEVKKFTGNDGLPYRKNYGSQNEMECQATFCTTSNDNLKYIFKYSDNGSKRRLAPIRWYSRFCEFQKDVDENKDNVKDIFLAMSEEEYQKILPNLSRALLSYLVHIYNTWGNNIEVPEEYEEIRLQIIDSNDHIKHYIKSYMVLSEDIDDWQDEELVYGNYRKFMQNTGESKCMGMDKFRKYFGEKVGKQIVNPSNENKKGWLLKFVHKETIF